MTKEVIHLPPVVGFQSLVGISLEKFPLESGNYFSMNHHPCPYILNCWAENLTEWSRRNPEIKEIEVTIFFDNGKNIGMITDKRMDGWLNDEFCVTGHGWPSREVEEEVSLYFKRVK